MDTLCIYDFSEGKHLKKSIHLFTIFFLELRCSEDSSSLFSLALDDLCDLELFLSKLCVFLC